MTVLSTLQSHWQSVLGNFDEDFRSKGLQTVLDNRWSIIAGTVASYVLYKYLTRPKNLPPGPRGLPIIGAALSLSENVHTDGIKFAKTYKSDVVSFYLGRQLNIQLYSSEAAREFLVRTDEFSYRDESFIKDFDLHEQFFLAQYSEEWNKLKAFCMTSLKTHGFGTTKSEENMKEQLRKLIARLDTLPDQGIESGELKKLLSKAGGCIIMKILLNHTFELDDPELDHLIDTVQKFNAVFFENAFLLLFCTNIFPAFIMWFIKKRLIGKARVAIQNLRDIYIPFLEEHKATLEINNSRDFMDEMLIRNAKTSNIMTDLQLIDSIVLFSPDAIDTNATQAQWVLFYVTWHQEVQDKMVKEIQKVCGDSQPCLKDRNSMPYCEAVILETYRLSSVAALTGGHLNIKDMKVMGYHIPKDTQVFAHLYAIHRDEKIFPEPDLFKPSRFLSSDGKLVNYENVLAFGTGRRKCVGEPLIKNEIFVYVTGIVQKFQLSFTEKPATMESDNVYRTCPANKMKFVARY